MVTRDAAGCAICSGSVKRPPLVALARRQQRGAAVFVVVMVLTMLTAVGVLAIRAATVSSTTSGYERATTQNQSVAECAITVAVSELASDRREAYIQKLLAGADRCLMTQGQQSTDGGTVPCYRIYAHDFPTNPCVIATNDAGAVESDFMVELTDPGPAGIPMEGTDVGGGRTFRYLQITMTGTGQVRPAGNVSTESIAAVAGNSTNRAFVVVGPVP